jgi:hypothetical protein
VVLDPERVFAHQIVRPLLDDGLGRLQVAPGAGLAESTDAGVGVHLNEHVPIDQERLNGGDLHRIPFPRWIGPAKSICQGRVARAGWVVPAGLGPLVLPDLGLAVASFKLLIASVSEPDPRHRRRADN